MADRYVAIVGHSGYSEILCRLQTLAAVKAYASEKSHAAGVFAHSIRVVDTKNGNDVPVAMTVARKQLFRFGHR